MGRRKEPTREEQLEALRKQRDEGVTELSLNTTDPELLEAAMAITTLTRLTLRGGLKALPASIGNLTALESLSIDGNELTTLPPTIGKLTRLEHLYAYSNKFRTLPEEIGELKRLKNAVLWSNELETLPAGIGGLASLEELELQRNPLRGLPEEIGRLANLKELDLENCQLKVLPATMAGMAKLRSLKLEGNRFAAIPEVLFALPALEVLHLNENQIAEIPAGIARAKALSELYLSKNKLRALPDELFALARLAVLELEENAIKEVPRGIGKLRGLTTLKLQRNPVKGIPEEVIAEGKEAIFAHLGLLSAEVVQDEKPADPKERAAIVARYRERIDQFRRTAKKKLHDEKMLEKVLRFLGGDDDTLPPARRDDHYGFGSIVNVLAPVGEWSFVDRRVIRFLARDAFYYRQPGYTYMTGYHDELFGWLKSQLAEEAGEGVFAPLAAELLRAGLDEETLVRASLRELDEQVVREDGRPTSYGRWLLEVAGRRTALVVEAAKERSAALAGITGLLLRHDPRTFETVADQLLEIKPDEDNEVHVPYKALAQVCATAPERYQALLLEAIAKTDCLPCKAEAGKILLEHYGATHRGAALEIAKETLAAISERKNKKDRYDFPWSGAARWSDGTPQYIEWALRSFGAELREAVFAYAEKTKVYDLDLAEAVARVLGQDGLSIVAEGLDMTIEDDGIAAHYRRLFTIMAPLDWSAHEEKVWEIAQSAFRSVRAAACLALARLPAERVVPRAKQLLAAKKAHEREAGVLILTLVKSEEARRILVGLLDTETSDDARDLIVESAFPEEAAIDAAEVERRVASAAKRGKLARPVAKWLDEKKLPPLFLAGAKKPLAPEAVRFLLHRQTRRSEIEVDPEARAVLALVDRARSGDFAEKLLALVQKNGGVMAKNRFALTLVGRLGDERVIAPLEELALEKRNENAIRTLGLLESEEAARALDRIAQAYRTKYPNCREAASEGFAAIAERRGLTPFELADAILPGFGLAPRGAPTPFAKTGVRIRAGSDGRLVLEDEKGKLLKSPPKAVPEKEKAALKQLGKEVAAACRRLAASLQYYLIVQRRWSPTAWEAFFVEHPLAHALARGLVWGSYGRKGLERTFRVEPGGALRDLGGAPVKLAKEVELGLVHPLDLDAKALEGWRQALADAGATPPFPQLERPIATLPDEEREKKISFRFEDKEVSCGTFKGRAERLGWRRGSVVDSGAVSAYRKLYPQDQIEVFIKTENLGVQTMDWESEVTLKELFFVKAGSVLTGSYTYDEPRDERDPRLVPLAQVPPIVYSETIADLDAILARKAEAEE